MTATHDAVNHPAHYTSHASGIEAIEVIEHYGVPLGNAIKYLWRLGMKDATAQELGKARWYVLRELDFLRRTQPERSYKVSYICPVQRGMVLGLVERYLEHEEEGDLRDVKDLLMHAPFYHQSYDALDVAESILFRLINHAKLAEIKAQS